MKIYILKSSIARQLQNKNDPNLSFCPADHPFIPVANLESEGIKLIEGIITLLYTSQYVLSLVFHKTSNEYGSRSPDIVSAIINSWVTLAKQRPSQTHIVISALASWTPAALIGSSYSTIKSVEKAIRILLVHISRQVILALRADWAAEPGPMKRNV